MDYSTLLHFYTPSILEYCILGIILLSFVCNIIAPHAKKYDLFQFEKMPVLIPVPIITKDMGFWTGIRTWLFTRRSFELGEDFNFTYDRNEQIGDTMSEYVIPKGFRTDCASIPRYLSAFLSPTGLLLIPGIVHDYCYRTGYYPPMKLLKKNKQFFYEETITRKNSDIWFHKIAISVNGFVVLNYIAYIGLRLTGWWGWNSAGHPNR